jgi:luciferase-type oxidoreductase
MTTTASALARLAGHDANGEQTMTLGIELPLDNDFTVERETQRRASTDPNDVYGIPDLSQHRERAELVDRLGFRAIWMRDVPLWLPRTFGDAGQVFDPIAYLGYLAAATHNVLLGTAAIVLPLRHPLLLAKQAATIDVLSGGRLILGVASGDRPQEYPAFGADFEGRGQTYRDSIETLRNTWAASTALPANADKVLPAPVDGTIPLVAVGRGQQTTEWAAANMDGYMTYHRPGPMMAGVVNKWNSSTPGDADATKPVITTMLVDLDKNPDAKPEPMRFGARLGRHALTDYLRGLQTAGVAHVALNFRPSRRPVEEALTEIAEHVLPDFDHEYAPRTPQSMPR